MKPSFTPLIRSIWLVFGGCLAWSVAAADVYVSNLANSFDAPYGISSNNYTSGNYPSGTTNSFVAQSFTTGNANYTLTSAQMGFSAADGSPNAPLTFALYSNGANEPGSSIVNFTTSDSLLTAGVKTFTPSSPTNLDANTVYWMVVSAPGSTTGAYQGNLTLDTNLVTQGGWSVNATYTGALIDLASAPNWTVFDSSSGLTMFAISAAVVPEPAMWPLLAGSLALGFVARRRLRAERADR